MNAQIMLIEQIPHVKIMENSPIRYSKGKRCFPWLARVKIDGKRMVLMLFKVIMENSYDSFGSGFKVQVFMWSFISEGRLSIISVMEYECEDEDGSVIGLYTQR